MTFPLTLVSVPLGYFLPFLLTSLLFFLPSSLLPSFHPLSLPSFLFSSLLFAFLPSVVFLSFKISGTAESTVYPLDENGRVEEVARILGGLSVTEAQMAAARDMIEEGKAYR